MFHVKHSMCKIIIIPILLLLFTSSSIVHPIHISVSEVNFKSQEQRVEVSIKIFTDDLEDGIEDLMNQPIALNADNESEHADKKISQYLNYNFNIELNDKEKLSLQFIGKEYVEDAIWCYLEGNTPTNTTSFNIKNSILNPYFDDQQNIIHFYKNKSRTNSFILKSNYTEAKIKL